MRQYMQNQMQESFQAVKDFESGLTVTSSPMATAAPVQFPNVPANNNNTDAWNTVSAEDWDTAQSAINNQNQNFATVSEAWTTTVQEEVEIHSQPVDNAVSQEVAVDVDQDQNYYNNQESAQWDTAQSHLIDNFNGEQPEDENDFNQEWNTVDEDSEIPQIEDQVDNEQNYNSYQGEEWGTAEDGQAYQQNDNAETWGTGGEGWGESATVEEEVEFHAHLQPQDGGGHEDAAGGWDTAQDEAEQPANNENQQWATANEDWGGADTVEEEVDANVQQQENGFHSEDKGAGDQEQDQDDIQYENAAPNEWDAGAADTEVVEGQNNNEDAGEGWDTAQEEVAAEAEPEEQQNVSNNSGSILRGMNGKESVITMNNDDLYWDDEFTPSLEYDPNMRLVTADDVDITSIDNNDLHFPHKPCLTYRGKKALSPNLVALPGS